MDSKKSNRSDETVGVDKTTVSRALPAWKWSGTHTLELVHALNERWLQALQGVNGAPLETNCRDAPAFRRQDLELWRTLDADALRRMAQTPFLLIDVQFHRLDWWKAVSQESAEGPKKQAIVAILSPRRTRQLLRETLTLVWHTTQSDPQTAALLLGIAHPVVDFFSSLDLEQLGRIASIHAGHLRPRWEQEPTFWRDLLLAAQSVNNQALVDIHLYGLQLLGRDALNVK